MQQHHEEEQPSSQWAHRPQHIIYDYGGQEVVKKQQQVQQRGGLWKYPELQRPLAEVGKEEEQQHGTHATTQSQRPPKHLQTSMKPAPGHQNPGAHEVDECEEQELTASPKQKLQKFPWGLARMPDYRWQTYTQSESVRNTSATIPAPPHQRPHPLYGVVNNPLLGVDCDVPFISSAPSYAASAMPQHPPEARHRGSSASDLPGSSVLAVPAASERGVQLLTPTRTSEAERLSRIGDEDEKNCLHVPRGSRSTNSQHVRGEDGLEDGGGDSTGAPTTPSLRRGVALGLQVPEDGDVDATVPQSIDEGANTREVSRYPWEGRLEREEAGRAEHQVGGFGEGPLPVLSLPFYSNVFSSETTSDSVGSSTSSVVSPVGDASCPSDARSPASTSPARDGCRSPSSKTCVAASRGGYCPTCASVHDAASGARTPETQGHAAGAAPAAVESPPYSTPPEEVAIHSDKSQPRARDLMAPRQQARRDGDDGPAEKKMRSTSAGDGENIRRNETAGRFHQNMDFSGQNHAVSPPTRRSSATRSSGPAAASSTCASSNFSPSASASPFSSSSSAAPLCCSTVATPSEYASSTVEAASSPVVAVVAESGFYPRRGHRRSSTWGRQLNGPGEAVEIWADKCIYRQQNVDRPEQRPILLPNGECVPGLRVVYDADKQIHGTHRGSAATFDWEGPMALPYNAEEAPPSPFSRGTPGGESSTRSSGRAGQETAGLPQVTPNRRRSAAEAVTAGRIPTLFLPPRYSLAEHPVRGACDTALNHVGFSPPSPFIPQPNRSSSNELHPTATANALPYQEVAARTCAVHKQLHTFVYPFELGGPSSQSAATAAPSSASTLFFVRQQSATAEPRQPVLTYCISNNGMGEGLPYTRRSVSVNKRRTRSPWLRWLWPWGGKQHAALAPQQEQKESSYELQVLPLALQTVVGTSSALIQPPSSLASATVGSRTEGGSSGSTSKAQRTSDHPTSSSSSIASSTSFQRVGEGGAAALSPPAGGPRRLSARLPHGSHSVSSASTCTSEERWKSTGRGTFILAAVSAALEIGCVWRFPSYCFKFGGATFLLAYVVLLLVLGLPVLALEMALGQVFRGGQMKVLNLISPRLRGVAVATLLLSFFICAYYSLFVSWTFHFLFSSIRPSLPWAITSQEAAICAAAGHDAAACSRATIPTPLFATDASLPQLRRDQVDGDQSIEEHQHQQQLLRQPLILLRAEETYAEMREKREDEIQQSFCAWRKPLGSDFQGVCVADARLKARTFLYTDVVGLWVKTTERLSSVPGGAFLYNTETRKGSPPASEADIEKYDAPTTVNSVTSDKEPGEEEGDGPHDWGAPPDSPSGPASLEDTEASNAAHQQTLPQQNADQKMPGSHHSEMNVRRLTPFVQTADKKVIVDAVSPRVTSVSMAASLWNLTPLVAVGLAAVWIQIYLFSLRVYKPTTTFMCVVSITPIAAMLLIAGLALSLDGATLGLKHLFSPSTQTLATPSSVYSPSSSFPSSSSVNVAPQHASLRHLAEDVSAGVRLSALSSSIYYSSLFSSPASSANVAPQHAALRSLAEDMSAEVDSSAAATLSPIHEGVDSAPGPAANEAWVAPVSSWQTVQSAALDGNSTAGASVDTETSSVALERWPWRAKPEPAELPRNTNNNNSGSSKGGLHSFVSILWPQWLTIRSQTLWGEAAAQVFFSLGVFQGVVSAYAAQKHLTENVLVDAVAAAVTNLGMSILAAVATFAVAGHVAKHVGAVDPRTGSADLSALQEVQGSQLVFVVYPLAFSSLPGGAAQITCVLSFLAFLLLGLTSVAGLVQPVVGLVRRCVWLEKYPRWKIAVAVCFAGLLTGLPFCTRGGLLLVEAADYRWTVVGLLFIGCCECLAFGWLYGVGRQAECIGLLPLILHGVTYWLAVLLAAVLLFLAPAPYNSPVTALAVSLSVGGAGVLAALWYCPWERPCGRNGRAKPITQQSSHPDTKKTKALEPPTEEVIGPRQAQQQTAKRKGRLQGGTAEKGRVKFTNGLAGGSSGSSSNTPPVIPLSSIRDIQRVDGYTWKNDGERHQCSQSHSTSSEQPSVRGDGQITSGTGVRINVTSDTTAAHSGRQYFATAPITSSEPCFGRTGDRACGRGDQHASPESSSAEPVASAQGGRNILGDPRGLPPMVTTSSGVGCEPDNSSNTDTVNIVTTGVHSSEGDINGSGNNLHSSSSLVYSSNGGSMTGSGNGSTSSNGNSNNIERQRDNAFVVDTPKLAAARQRSETQRQQKRYRSPRSRTSRRRRGKREFVFIKRDGETLPFSSCVFWLFVGNAEHLRKNLNAITCSGYRVLRLWPPWSIIIRYVIPTILMLLVVQELPQLFANISRYSQGPPAATLRGRSAGGGGAAAFVHTGLHSNGLRQTHATQPTNLLLSRRFSPEDRRQHPEALPVSQQQTEEEQASYRGAPVPTKDAAAWRSLVAIQVFTLGALLLVVSLVFLGLLSPQLWSAFIPREKKRHGLDTTCSAVSSSFQSVSSHGSSSLAAAVRTGIMANATSAQRTSRHLGETCVFKRGLP